MKPKEILQEELEKLEQEFLVKYREKGMEASGDWGRSLETKVSQSSDGSVSGSVRALKYSQQLESGRSPGKQPPREAIEKWIKEKGIASRIESKISVSSLAFLIARKIAREGWSRKRFGGVELISEVATPQRMQQIIDKVGQSYISLVTSEVTRTFKELAA